MTKKNEESVAVVKKDADLTVRNIVDLLEELYKKLSEQEKLFVRNYLATNNMHDSAIVAGYSETSAYTHIYTVRKREHVSEVIRLEKLRLYKSLKISDELLLHKLAVVANANIADYIEITTEEVLLGYGKKGKKKYIPVTTLSIKDSKDIPYEIMAAIKSIKQTKHGIELVLHDMPAAVQRLAEYSGLFKGDQGGDLASRLLSDITVQGMELSIKVMKDVEIKEAEVVDE